MSKKTSKFSELFSKASQGGNRRILILSGIVVLVMGLIASTTLHRTRIIPKSEANKTADVNALPGGTNTNAMQDQLRHDQMADAAQKAQQTGASYTPDIAPGQVTHDAKGRPIIPDGPHEVGDTPAVTYAPPVTPPAAETGLQTPPADAPIPTDPARVEAPTAQTPEEAQAAQKRQERYAREIARVQASLVGKPPQTTVQDLPASIGDQDDAHASQAVAYTQQGSGMNGRTGGPIGEKPHVLIPAGRGIYAHTVMATNSDLAGEIVLEADTGPIAGDRMIANVSRAGGHNELLVLKVTKVIHDGQELNTKGVVLSPRTMVPGVASSVDPLVFQRFILPAAAQFVMGLGQAIETTSNSVGNLGALGNVSYVQRLNLGQQMGIAAGSAASALNNAIAQDTPTQSRINLDDQANVAVMFMSNVVAKP